MTSNKQKALIFILGVIVVIELAFNYKQMQENNTMMEDMKFDDLQFARQSELEQSGMERKEHIKLCLQEVEMKIKMLKECNQRSLRAKNPEAGEKIASKKKQGNKKPKKPKKPEKPKKPKKESASIKSPEDLQNIILREQAKTDKCFFKRKELGIDLGACEGNSIQAKANVFKDKNFLDRIKSFVLFIGYARSGHSIVAALLDAHPHIAISHELHIMKRWDTSYRKDSTKTRIDLFNEILNNTVDTISDQKGFRSPNLTRKYYTLDVPGLYQGKYEDYLQIIGDKKGGALISLLKGPDIELTEFEEFQKFVGFPLKIIHIVRNPYDNIATKSLYGVSTKLRKKVADNETIQLVDNELVMKFTESHLRCYKEVPNFIKYFGEDMLTLKHEDLIENSKLFLTRICNFLEISCSTHYLDTASEAVFKSPTKSRHSVQWTEEMKNKVEKLYSSTTSFKAILLIAKIYV